MDSTIYGRFSDSELSKAARIIRAAPLPVLIKAAQLVRNEFPDHRQVIQGRGHAPRTCLGNLGIAPRRAAALRGAGVSFKVYTGKGSHSYRCYLAQAVACGLAGHIDLQAHRAAA